MDETGSSAPPLFINSIETTAPEPGPLAGPSGAGWGFLLYLLIFAIVLTISNLILRFLVPAGMTQIWKSVIGEGALIVSGFVPGFVMARIENRPFGAYGLPRKTAFGSLFWMGMLWGIVGLSVLMVALRIAGAFYFGGIALGGFKIFKFGVFWAVFFLGVALVEEFLLRGYTQFTLGRGLGFWPTAIMLSCAFGAVHLNNKGENPAGALAAAIIGLFFCLTLKRTGNLWFAVGLHCSWDWGQTYLYSVANSGLVAPGHLLNSHFQGPEWLTGGSVGPEASVFVFVVMALMWIIFHYAYPPKSTV